ncbi:hypothetical protein Cba03nite_07780 [Catellatospora bangladeshensis]|uniref:Uncharacterized protein n=2 Tax=Catellatospora bangladeshensis TaxID=310355 RepID=A0A8J3JK28_9ACTN|nr:hypothetical protein Cba03nite_07780 [Catellatospora bangladeshensis]
MDVTGQTDSTTGPDEPGNGSTANGRKPGGWADERTGGWSSAGAALEPGFEPLTPWHAQVADRRGIEALSGADPLTATLLRSPEAAPPAVNGQHRQYADQRPLPEPSSPGEDPYADELAQSSAEFARHAAFDEPTPSHGSPRLSADPAPPVFTPFHPEPVAPPEVVPIPVMPPLPTGANPALTVPTGGYPVPPPGLRPSLPAELTGPVPALPAADAPLAAAAAAATRAVPPVQEARMSMPLTREREEPPGAAAPEVDDQLSLGARFGMAFAEPPLPVRPSRQPAPPDRTQPGPADRAPAARAPEQDGPGRGLDATQEFARPVLDHPEAARPGEPAEGGSRRAPAAEQIGRQVADAVRGGRAGQEVVAQASGGPGHQEPAPRGEGTPSASFPGQPSFTAQPRPYIPPAPPPPHQARIPHPQSGTPAAERAAEHVPAAAERGDTPAEAGGEHLPQRVPAVPDVPPTIHPVAEAEATVAATPQLDRIASHLRRNDDAETDERPDGFDVDAVLRAVRGVAGVRDAALRTTPTGAHHLRLDLAEGADPAAISRMVARMLQEQMGIDAAPAGPAVPKPAPASDGPPPTATLPAPRSGAGAAPPPGLQPDPLSDTLPREPRRRHPVNVPRRAPGELRGPGELRDRVAALRSVNTEPELPAAASPPPLPTERDQGPRAIIEHVQTSTFGLDATVEVRLNTGDRQAVGVASGPAVDAYVLRLCAAATAVAIDDLLREGTTTGESGRCFVEQATIVPMGSCEVAVVVVLLVCGGWVEQLAGSALVAGDPRRAVVRATLSAVNRRLAALLP